MDSVWDGGCCFFGEHDVDWRAWNCMMYLHCRATMERVEAETNMSSKLYSVLHYHLIYSNASVRPMLYIAIIH